MLFTDFWKMLVIVLVLSTLIVNTNQQNNMQNKSVNCVQDQCNRMCRSPEGECLPNGRCRCILGTTGPNATGSGMFGKIQLKNGSIITRELVEADHCLWDCNPLKVGECNSKCSRRCGFPMGECLPNGWCLCWWGWTGPNAFFVKQGEYPLSIVPDIKGLIKAHYCYRACHFTKDFHNPWCAQVT